MQPGSILQIVSGFKPSVDGMGDFARKLGDKLWERHQIRSHFVVYRTPATPFDAKEISPNTISYATDVSLDALSRAIEGSLLSGSFDSVLLHYGSYAYSSNGRPDAFVRMISQFAKSTRFLIFFHELYAIGMPWRRAFWTMREQKQSVGDLVAGAAALFTSNARYVEQLSGFDRRGIPITKIPIFSNIGEPQLLRPLHQRTRQLIIFGQLPTRLRLYRRHRKLGIESVVDVGSGKSPQIPTQLGGAQVRSAGWMEDRQLSDLMADSMAGIIVYWPDRWEKSGVIAAYQAHAVVPILVELEAGRSKSQPFVPYLLPREIAKLAATAGNRVPDAKIQQIADAAHDQYQKNQTADHCADTIAQFVSSDESQAS
jgi:hypothetical protein